MYSVSSIVEKNVVLGQGTNVWYFSHVCAGVRTGIDCNIGEKSYVGHDVLLGDNVRIGNNVNIYEGAIIKNNVRIGNNTCFTNVRKVSTKKKADNILNTIVEDGAIIGANATIVGGVKIGKNAIVADGSVVVGNVPDGAWANGNPAKIKIRKQ